MPTFDRQFRSLPTHWPYGRFRGQRISTLPGWHLQWAIRHERYWKPSLRAAIWAEMGFRVMATDQWEGR